MQRDFKSPAHRPGISHAHWVGLVISIAVLSVILVLVTNSAKATRSETLSLSPDQQASFLETNALGSQAALVTMPLSIPHNEMAVSATPEQLLVDKETIDWQTAVVKSGDTLAAIFSRLGLSSQELYRVMQAGKDSSLLTRLVPGQQLRFQIDNQSLQQLVYQVDALKTLKVLRSADAEQDFVLQTDVRELESRVTNTSGVIDSSLFLAGQSAGLSDSLIMQLAGIFGWDIDFVLDIRAGDRFTVVYEELYLDGEKQRDGNIVAAEFINQGQIHRAVRYTSADDRTDYYSPDGSSMRKAFLRTPVDFTRISSRFGKRVHPISGAWKNHHGVDYVAPHGTPIKAAGEGKVIHIGNKGGYGKTIILQHGGNYSTLYAHMSRYQSGLRHGARVRQGQTIGYVGTTGYSTGPHLHYEFRVDGVHRNPLTVRLPDAAPIEARFHHDFQTASRGLLALLDVLQRTTLALNDTASNQ